MHTGPEVGGCKPALGKLLFIQRIKKLDIESIMSSLRMDLEKEWNSLRMN